MNELPRYEPPACVNCKAFAPECMVPHGDYGSVLPMCWLCAHVVTEHDAVLYADVCDCGCTAEQIYPPDVLARRGRPQEAVSGEIIEPKLPVRSVYSSSYGLDGKRDPNGPMLVMNFEETAPGQLRPLSIEVREPDHSTRVSRGMRAAARARGH